MRENKVEFSKAVINFFSAGRLHVDLMLLENGVVKIQRYDMRSDELENSFALFDLKKFWLPANGIYDSPTSLLSRDDLVCVILLFLNNFMFRTRSTKGRHNRAKVEAKQCIKFFEYLWLRGYLELSIVPQSLMMEFAEDIAKVGWIGVLNIESRLHELVARYPQRPRMSREEFSQLLATNIEGSDFGIIYGVYLAPDIDDNKSSFVEQPLGYSSMRHLLGALNNLYGLSEGLGLRKFPYINSVALSRTLTSAPQRTPNIGPGDAAVLLSGSFEIVLSYADQIVSLLRDISTLVIDNFKLGRFELGAGIEKLVINSGINKIVVFHAKAW